MKLWWKEIDRCKIESVVVAGRYMKGQPSMSMDTDDLPLMKPSSVQSNDAILFSYENAIGERRIFRKEVEDTFVNFKPIITSSNTFSIAEIQSFYYPPPVPRLPNTALPAQGRKPFGGLLRLYK